MRTQSLLILTLVVVPVFTSVGRAADDDAKAILSLAMKAAGGEPSLGRLKAQTMWMERGTYYGEGDKRTPFIAQYSSKWPDWYRREIEGVSTFTASGDKAWASKADKVQKFEGDRLKDAQHQVRAAWATRLFPLTGKDYTLGTIDGIDVDGKPTLGIKASHTGGPDIKFYFDKNTYLLAKMETLAIIPEHGSSPVLSEAYYTDYKGFGGGMMPSKFKLYRDKKLFADGETVDYKVFATLDPKLFEAPK
jgi:hypothetical protein